MMRKPRLDRHLRIIGMPRRSVAKYGGGLPMMRFAQRSCVYRIIGMPFVQLASFRHALLRYLIYIFNASVEIAVFMVHVLGVKQWLFL